jgi:hypothetical protein
MHRLRSALWFVLMLLCATALLFSQTQITTGTIQAVVKDESGGVLPGASVTIRNVETNFQRNLTTGPDGRFVAPQLPPGRYSVTVSQPGFATLVQDGLALTVGQAISLSLTLKVSAVQQTITVTGSPVLDTTKTESSSTLNERTVESTPVLGRKFEDLLTLTPGVSIVQGPDGDEINFNGQRGIFNNISLDGGDYNNGFFGEQYGGQRAAIDITMDAVKEFQVVATGASAEFGRTAGGVVNVVTKSGTNDLHGSFFHFQRLEGLSANTSDGKPLRDFHREQFGGTIGGPIVKDRMFYFGAIEQITGNLTRDNLSAPIGSQPCPVANPTIQQSEALINSNTECQRLALLEFFRSARNQEEGFPVERPVNTTASLAKFDWLMTPNNNLSASYNFTRSRKENETFDVATYGNSANGTEGPAKIHAVNLNLFSTVSSTKLNEGHFTYSREDRPRSATPSNVPADTAMGFVTTFRFGNPFFLQPTIDELFWRTQARDNFTLIARGHTLKFGGEWVHSVNTQVFRGFFTGRYIFDTVTGFLRYASSASFGPGFGPDTQACSDGSFTSFGAACPAGATSAGSPLLLYLQGAALRGPTTDAAGFSDITNEDLALYVQDKWQVWPNLTLNLGLRWEAQIFPDPVVPPAQTAYGKFLGNPLFPSDGTLPNQKKQFQPRFGFAWDITGNRKAVLRGSAGIFNARQNMLTQVGSITTNGVQQQTIAAGRFVNPTVPPGPVWPNVIVPAPVPEGQFPLFTGVRVFSSDYHNPRIYSVNIAYEHQFATDWAGYADFSWNKGVFLTRFVNINNGSRAARDEEIPEDARSFDRIPYVGEGPFVPALGEVMVTSSSAKSLYRGATFGMRKRFRSRYQLDWNYTVAKDLDDDSNERDPFTDRSFNRFNFQSDYAPSDRDIRHRFNLALSAEIPGRFDLNVRTQARSAQPITTNPAGDGSGPPCGPSNSGTRVVNGTDCGRNHLRKDNEFSSFDWRLERVFRIRDSLQIVPVIEMFNTFNSKNNVNPLTTPGLFNFDGFLRQGVGDPRQVQLAIKFVF